jgi:hypothetical protein
MPPPEPTPVTPSAVPSPPAQQSIQLAANPTTQTIVPASYAAPIAASQPVPNLPPSGLEQAPAAGPWRAPVIAQPSSPTSFAAQPAASSVIPGYPPQSNVMDVQIRAVPSPPPEPVEPNTPRIRLPGYTPQPMTGAGQIGQPALFYATAIPTAAGSMVQTASLGPIPQSPYDPTRNLAAASGATGSHDGFRPRSSIR